MIILAYHRIADESCDPWGLSVSLKNFAEQLEVLEKWTQVVPLRQLVAWAAKGTVHSRCVAITFDDGYADNVTVAQPMLERRDFCATFFVVSDYVGAQREFWWDELERLLLLPGRLPATFELRINGSTVRANLSAASDYSNVSYYLNRDWRSWVEAPTPRHSLYYSLWQKLRLMRDEEREQSLAAIRSWCGVDSAVRTNRQTLNTSQLSKLAGNPLIEVGCHTKTHAYLYSLPISTQRDQIQGCREFLEHMLGRTVKSFSYPYGSKADYSHETVSLVRELGFSSACSTIPGSVTADSDLFQLPRMAVENWDGEAFTKKLSEWFGEH